MFWFVLLTKILYERYYNDLTSNEVDTKELGSSLLIIQQHLRCEEANTDRLIVLVRFTLF